MGNVGSKNIGYTQVKRNGPTLAELISFTGEDNPVDCFEHFTHFNNKGNELLLYLALFKMINSLVTLINTNNADVNFYDNEKNKLTSFLLTNADVPDMTDMTFNILSMRLPKEKVDLLFDTLDKKKYNYSYRTKKGLTLEDEISNSLIKYTYDYINIYALEKLLERCQKIPSLPFNTLLTFAVSQHRHDFIEKYIVNKLTGGSKLFLEKNRKNRKNRTKK